MKRQPVKKGQAGNLSEFISSREIMHTIVVVIFLLLTILYLSLCLRITSNLKFVHHQNNLNLH